MHIREALPVGGDAPSPEQLFHLASRAVVLAKHSQGYRKYDRAKNPRSHFMVPRSEVIVPDVWEAPFGYRYEHRFAARISKVGYRTWSMRMRIGYDVTEMGSQRGCERHQYSFRWDHVRTHLARHVLRVAPTVDRDIVDYIDAFAAIDDLAGDFSWRSQLEEITAGDVELLTKDVETFGWDQRDGAASARQVA